MSRWLDAFREASVRKAAPVQLAQLGADSAAETPNCTFPTYPHQSKRGKNEVPEPQGADEATEREGAPKGADGLARLGTIPSPADAERLAVEAAIARWLSEHPPHDVVADTCAGCGAALGPTRGLPLADGSLVCEAEDCWKSYVARRRAEAEKAMSQ